jgi:hypothetical protein
LTYREPSPPAPSIVELGPIGRPSRIVFVLVLATVIAPAFIAYWGIRTLYEAPERSTLECVRNDEIVTCDELNWWKQGDGWRSQKVATHSGRQATLRYSHIGGKSPKDCIVFSNSLPCGGPASANVETLKVLPDRGQKQLDLTRHEGFGLVMGFGSIFGILAITWVSAMGYLLRRRTRVRVTVLPGYLEIETRWGGLVRRKPRVLPRVKDELARVVMAERGGRGQLPTWRIEYGGGTEDFAELLTISALQKPFELEQAAASTRAALMAVPQTFI